MPTTAAARKIPPQEPLTTYGLIQLVNAQFSEGFLLDLLGAQPVKISTDASNLVQLKEAGLSERVLAAIEEGTVKAAAGSVGELGKGVLNTATGAGKTATDAAGNAAKGITDLFKKKK